jgi:putative ABC transport system ATP-binding protein
MIHLENVSKRFRKNDVVINALDDVSLEVPKGALALVRGPSGSGKTTLINVVAGLTPPTAGSLTVAGERLDALTPRARTALRARRIAVVFQMFHLVPYLTALENVLLPTLAAFDKDAFTRANDLMQALAIDHRAAHFPSELSAGERQRCALARAVQNRPEVILADEPTGNLDQESADLVLATLRDRRDQGATVLLVSHHHIDTIPTDIEFALKEGRLQA